MLNDCFNSLCIFLFVAILSLQLRVCLLNLRLLHTQRLIYKFCEVFLTIDNKLVAYVKFIFYFIVIYIYCVLAMNLHLSLFTQCFFIQIFYYIIINLLLLLFQLWNWWLQITFIITIESIIPTIRS